MEYDKNNQRGVDIAALMRALPVSTLESECIAYIGGFFDAAMDSDWRNHIRLLEPPAGKRISECVQSTSDIRAVVF